jgi:periplasmic divalent cation tolerance protein
MESAKTIAHEVLESKLAACISIAPGIISMYEWQGSLEEAHEHLLLIKTVAANVEALFSFVQSRHPYDCPELLALPVSAGIESYLNWVQNVTAMAS